MPARLTEAQRLAGEALGFGGRPSPAQAPAAVVATNYRPIGKNTLVASVDLTVPRWRLTFRGCLLHRKGTKEWIAFGAREWVDRSGNKQYADLIQFTDRATFDRFQIAALAAVNAVARNARPEGKAS
jgi:hypothetical protein